MRTVLFATALAAFGAVVSAFPNGAGTCLSNQTIIAAVPNAPMGNAVADLGFSFNIGLTGGVYVPNGNPVDISVVGKQKFNGLLLYAVDSKLNHVGQFKLQTGIQYKTGCLGDPSGTVTQTDPTPKGPNLKLSWTPPNSDVGPIRFVGTLVVSKAVGFQVVKDNNTFIAKGSTPTSSGAAGTTPPATPSGGAYSTMSMSSTDTAGNSPQQTPPADGTSSSATSTATAGAKTSGGALISPVLMMQLITATAFAKLLLGIV